MEKTKNQNQLKRIIRDMGVKVTQQRLVILEHIMGGGEHITAQQVFETVHEKHSDIGFATVYRFLRTLCDQKLLTEVRMRGLPARYEWADKSHHDHLVCTSCNKIVEFENSEIENLQLLIAQKLGFKLTDHILELYGVCMECQTDIKTPKNESTTSFGASL